MENALIVFQQICIMIFYLAIGLLLFHTKLITLEGSKSLANLLLYVVLPAAVLNSFCVERSSQRVQMLIVSILGSVGVLGISMLLSHLMFKKDPLNDFGVAFSNAGFMASLWSPLYWGRAPFLLRRTCGHDGSASVDIRAVSDLGGSK